MDPKFEIAFDAQNGVWYVTEDGVRITGKEWKQSYGAWVYRNSAEQILSILSDEGADRKTKLHLILDMFL